MFERIIKSFSGVRILVVGDIMLDRFIWGGVSRISPEAPVPVVVVEKETFLLGGAANVVNNIHSLGGKASLCGVIGDDEMGQKVVQRLSEMGIERSGVSIEPGRQTTVKTRIIAHHQQLVRIDRETTQHPKVSTLRSLSDYLKQNIKRFDGVILSDYGKGLLTRSLVRDVIRKAGEAGKFVMVDPKIKNFFFYRGATVVTPNTGEASSASRISIMDEASLNRAGRNLLKRLRCDALVITRGEDGMAIFEPHQKPFLVPTEAKEVYDVTGAGDTVIGTMALALGAGANIRRAAELANHAAGIVVGKVGTATVDQKELTSVMKERFRLK
ncbi:MAG: D-glycero-beta-D-manno-heptose-7-phosphate kinase [Thermodesulfobacteriota bacterium]|nr:D-glycero-beta-D-manno-heptose-7-phosphate kinase [Thermodesulfobacteriota bacterium]